MQRRIPIISLVTTCALFLSAAVPAAPQSAFTPAQTAEIGKIAGDYLLAHPDILVQVSQQLMVQQAARQQALSAAKVMEQQKALLHDADTPVTGPAGASVAVIEFFDYQCVHCSGMAPDMEAVMKASPDVQFIFKEWPIFASQWAASEKAALRGLDVWRKRGGDGYLAYHTALYHTGHIEGALTDADIDAAGQPDRYDTPDSAASTAALERNDVLAQALGLTGTPGLVVMPVDNVRPEAITVFAGGCPLKKFSRLSVKPVRIPESPGHSAAGFTSQTA
ncbi:MAG TPA: thioredoxin domain-containing protein [Buttiauxella sp.]|jgi:protein-disulfide isomerase